MNMRKFGPTLVISLTAVALTACAGTAPIAQKRGYEAAQLDAKRRVKCELTRDIQACARDRDLNAVDPLEDDGFLEAQYKQDDEARRDQKRREKGK